MRYNIKGNTLKPSEVVEDNEGSNTLTNPFFFFFFFLLKTTLRERITGQFLIQEKTDDAMSFSELIVSSNCFQLNHLAKPLLQGNSYMLIKENIINRM